MVICNPKRPLSSLNSRIVGQPEVIVVAEMRCFSDDYVSPELRNLKGC